MKREREIPRKKELYRELLDDMLIVRPDIRFPVSYIGPWSLSETDMLLLALSDLAGILGDLKVKRETCRNSWIIEQQATIVVAMTKMVQCSAKVNIFDIHSLAFRILEKYAFRRFCEKFGVVLPPNQSKGASEEFRGYAEVVAQENC